MVSSHMAQRVGWVERKRNPSLTCDAVGFAALNPPYGSYGSCGPEGASALRRRTLVGAENYDISTFGL